MKQRLLEIALNHFDLLARQRAKRLLRIRYGFVMANNFNKPRPDPVWLSAYLCD